MTNDTQKQVVQYEELLDAKLIELLQTQNDIREFTESEHKAKDTKKYQKAVQKMATEINDIIILLADSKKGSGDFKDEFRRLHRAGLELNTISTDLVDALRHDLEQRQKSETIDVKSAVGIMAGLAGLTITMGRFGLEHETARVLSDATVGAGFGVFVSFPKETLGLFKRQAQNLAKLPNALKKGAVCLAKPLNNEGSIMLVGETKRRNIQKEKIQQKLNAA